MTKKLIARRVPAIAAIITIAAFLGMFVACGDPHSFKKAENAQDAGREFIRASLDGNYEKASFYLYLDSAEQNKMMLDKWKKDFDAQGTDERAKYKDADILPINIQNQNDSVTLYTYANSYKKDTTTIRIVRINGEWLVDLKEIIKSQR